MISDEERCDVAENLRSLTICHFIQYKEQFFDELAEVVLGFEDVHDFNVVLEKLADLIDRPTCHMEGTSRSGFRCSACGEQIPPMRIFYRDSAGDHWVPMEHNLCPMCGAEVVK